MSSGSEELACMRGCLRIIASRSRIMRMCLGASSDSGLELGDGDGDALASTAQSMASASEQLEAARKKHS